MANGDELRVLAVDGIDGLEKLQAGWMELIGSAGIENPFLTPDWMRAWDGSLRPERTRPLVLAVLDGDRLAGVAPLCATEPRFLGARRLGFATESETGADYLDVVCLPGREDAVAAALYDHMFGGSEVRWHALTLRAFNPESLFLHHFVTRLERAGKSFSLRGGAICPFTVIPEPLADATELLRPARRKRQRWELRALGREGRVQHNAHAAGESGFPAAFEIFSGLYVARWGQERRSLLACVAAAAGVLGTEIDLLYLDQQPIAGLLHFRCGTRAYLYLMAVDRSAYPKLSVGNLLVAASIARVSKGGVREYHFLRGDEPYKFLWANRFPRCLELEIRGRHPVIWLEQFLAAGSSALKAALR